MGLFIQRPSGSASNGIIPVGGIIMWSGTIATIPANWALCDGTANSPGPDLRDKFIVGATSDSGGIAKTNLTGALTQSGGNASHTHSVTSNVSIADHSSHVHVGSANHSDHVHAGSADHSAHTHTGPSHQHNLSGGAATAHGHDYTTVIAHTHKLATGTGSSGNFAQVLGTIDASSGGTGAAPTQSNVDTASQSTGSASGTTANNAAGTTDNAGTGASGNPDAALSHANTGNPTAALTHANTGNETATITHNPTNNAVTSGNNSTVSVPYFALAFIQRMT